jgi:hypothetical protein
MDVRQLAYCILAAVVCMALITVTSEVRAAALEDQLPDTTGLFFGKRAAHPNMNNLLFGRRSFSSRQLMERPLTEDVCKAVHISCSKLGLNDDEQP